MDIRQMAALTKRSVQNSNALREKRLAHIKIMEATRPSCFYKCYPAFIISMVDIKKQVTQSHAVQNVLNFPIPDAHIKTGLFGYGGFVIA